MNERTNEPAALRDVGDPAEWWATLEDITEERGYFEPLRRGHAALFSEGGPVLFITFEAADAIRARRDSRAPLAWDLADAHGWSSLVLLGEGQSWFRDASIYAYFDRLVDDGFFDEFDRVVVYGAGPAGYAAAAYSVAAPGATVIALQPQATLSPDCAEWDRRFPEARRRDFDSRYGYAPAMTEAANAAYIVYDPAIPEDAMHATLFAFGGAVRIRARHFGADLPFLLEQSGALHRIVAAAGDGRLTEATIWQALRARRDSSAWLRQLLDRLEAAERPEMVARLCRHVLPRKRAPRFRKALEQATEQIAARAPAQDAAAALACRRDSDPAPAIALTSINAPEKRLS